MTKQRWSLFFLVAAVVMVGVAAWQARHQLTVLTTWKATEGKLMGREVLRNHDEDGVLYFQMKGMFRYPVNGSERTSSAESYFGSSEFGWIAQKTLAYKAGGVYPLRYNPANPDIFEFSPAFNAVYFEKPLWCLGASILCLLLGLMLRRLSMPKRRCPQCTRSLRSFFRYCPQCGESILLA